MKIELKKVHYSATLSQETKAFTADVYINGVKAASASNEGGGGPTSIDAYPGQHKLVEQAEAYCESQPKRTVPVPGSKRTFEIAYDLEYAIDEVLTEYLVKQDQKKADAKYFKAIQKHSLKSICYGDDDRYSRVTISVPIADLVEPNGKYGQKGVDALINALETAKQHMKEGQRILNDNIPAAILQKVFPK